MTDNTPAGRWASIADDNLTTKQAADWLRRSDATLKRWRRMRIGPPFFTVNGRVLYSKTQLQAWVETCRQQSQEAA
ncbi:helix-turn-helix domain-containing protein [Pseudoxanthomonas sp. Soil82]|uniref:helix-turn-helix domain-containing protein n=1 Tax=Pseudoxanthomonas sp. Soil82 TaxID=3157341 RepID=UPI00338E1F96